MIQMASARHAANLFTARLAFHLFVPQFCNLLRAQRDGYIPITTLNMDTSEIYIRQCSTGSLTLRVCKARRYQPQQHSFAFLIRNCNRHDSSVHAVKNLFYKKSKSRRGAHYDTRDDFVVLLQDAAHVVAGLGWDVQLFRQVLHAATVCVLVLACTKHNMGLVPISHTEWKTPLSPARSMASYNCRSSDVSRAVVGSHSA